MLAFMTLLTRAPRFDSHVRLHFGVRRDRRLPHELDICLSEAGAVTRMSTHAVPRGSRTSWSTPRNSACPADAIHLERFKAEPASETRTSLASFQESLASTGQTVKVDEKTSIVRCPATIGIEVDTSCGEGVCGACIVDVIAAKPEHRDHCLSKAERAATA